MLKSEIIGNRLPRRQRTYTPCDSFKPKLEKRNKGGKGEPPTRPIQEPRHRESIGYNLEDPLQIDKTDNRSRRPKVM